MNETTAIATTTTTQLAHRQAGGALEFNDEQRKIIRDSYANGASDTEFAVLMEVAKSRRLNPLLRQIFFVKRWDSEKRCEVWASQVSIDGMRAIAERTGLYDGQDEPQFENGKNGELLCCRVRVYRKDWSRPSVGVAYFTEFAQTKRDGGLTHMWGNKPHVMLAKCAEAQAIRRAFPEDTSDLYIEEEIRGRESDGERSARIAEAVVERAAELPPAPFPTEMQERIFACESTDQLKALVEEIKALPNAHKAAMRAAYQKRASELAPKKTAASASNAVVDAEVVREEPGCDG